VSVADRVSATQAAGMETAPRIAEHEMGQLLALLRDADSAELKLSVPASDLRATVVALGLDPLDAQIRQVFFFDTPDLALDRHGLVVRARRVQKRGDDSVVKLRPVVPSELPERVRKAPGFKVEVDAMPGKFVCSGSMSRELPPTAVKEVVAGAKPMRKLFSKAQRAFFDEHAPESIGLGDLGLLGPIFVLKLKASPTGYAGKLVAELWLYPDGSHILELSTKCAPEEAFRVAAEARAFLAERGVSLAGDQATKTRAALEFFARRLASSSG
jgi:hypothetical protein